MIFDVKYLVLSTHNSATLFSLGGNSLSFSQHSSIAYAMFLMFHVCLVTTQFIHNSFNK